MSHSLYAKENGYDMFGDDDDSSDQNQSSSEDEIDVILHGTPEQRRKLQNLHRKWIDGKKDGTNLQDSSSSSEDEFEKEMDAELTSHINFLENSRGALSIQSNPANDSTNQANTTQAEASEEFYDDIYFDSDNEDEDACNTKKKSKHKVISNDDLLYDPDMDDKDQRWVDKQRQSHRQSTTGKLQKKANSDALLDCPACLTTLCIDCQRHETHNTQYRAMFVMNCTIDTSEKLECPEQIQKKKKKKRKNKANNTNPNSVSQGNEMEATPSVGSNDNSKDLFHPVRCSECNTVVGVYDVDEVHHFFNIIASHT